MSWITDSNSLSLFPFFDLKKKKKTQNLFNSSNFQVCTFHFAPCAREIWCTEESITVTIKTIKHLIWSWMTIDEWRGEADMLGHVKQLFTFAWLEILNCQTKTFAFCDTKAPLRNEIRLISSISQAFWFHCLTTQQSEHYFINHAADAWWSVLSRPVTVFHYY